MSGSRISSRIRSSSGSGARSMSSIGTRVSSSIGHACGHECSQHVRQVCHLSLLVYDGLAELGDRKPVVLGGNCSGDGRAVVSVGWRFLAGSRDVP